MAAITQISNQAAGVLTVDLNAIKANWQILANRSDRATTGAVVKANAYGLGVEKVAPTLWNAGARRFYVAQVEEGLDLRQILPSADIVVLSPLLPEGLEAAVAADLVVSLNNEQALGYWTEASNAPRAAVQIDTGMTRLGFEDTIIKKLWNELDSVKLGKIEEVLSHLACADDAAHPMNHEQLIRFERSTKDISPGVRRSLANSSGVFLGGAFLQNSTRPGMALYGLNPIPGSANPMHPVVSLDVRILQIRQLSKDENVGYGATARAKAGTVIATIAAGYADGLQRSLSNLGHVFISGEPASIIGRVSMDLIAVDVSHLPEKLLNSALYAQIIGSQQSTDDLADAAGTIGYEILTSIGHRYARHYKVDL